MKRRVEVMGMDTDAAARRLKRAVSLVVLAGAMFAGAFMWFGGAEGLAEILGDTYESIELTLGSADGPELVVESGRLDDGIGDQARIASSYEVTATAQEATASVNAEDVPTERAVPAIAPSSLPPDAQVRMYREQLQSQNSLGNLAAGEMAAARLGTTAVSGDAARVPLTVTYRDGGSISGTMMLRRYEGLWYFYSLYSGGTDDSIKPQTVDSSVVEVITAEQGEIGTQQLLADGVIANGFETVRVDGVTMGSGTATVNVTLLGGVLNRRAARFVMISKVDSGHKLWFLTRFELK